MRPLRLVLAVVALLVGLLWIGQGTGAVGGTAMTGQSIWAIIGIVLLVVAAVIGWREVGVRRRS